MCKTAMPLNSSGNCVSYAPERRGQKISETAILPNNVSRINNENSKECMLLCGKISRTTALAKAYCYICLTYLFNITTILLFNKCLVFLTSFGLNTGLCSIYQCHHW